MHGVVNRPHINGKDAVAGSIRGSMLRRRSRCGSSRAAGSSSIGPTTALYDVYDFFDPVPAAETDATVDGYERIDTRPRVRVYGCCLPIALGMLLALVATVTLLANLLVGAL